jgi:hypothetical protein
MPQMVLTYTKPRAFIQVLHGILVNPPIAIVGLSNWVLDPAKMNRAICLQVGVRLCYTAW